MARFEKVELANGAPGVDVDVQKLRDKYVQTSGGYTGTLDVQGSIDGTNFRTVLSALSAGAFTALPHTLVAVRLDDTNVSAGAPAVSVGGFNERAK